MNPKELEMFENAKASLRFVLDHWEIIDGVQRVVAKAKRTFYEECLKSGFRPDEALMLTIHHDPLGVKRS